MQNCPIRPAQTNTTLALALCRKSTIEDKLRNEPTNKFWADTQALMVRVPFVVVITICFPETNSGVNFLGELPKSKPLTFKPFRSPQQRTSGSSAATRKASSGVKTG